MFGFQRITYYAHVNEVLHKRKTNSLPIMEMSDDDDKK